MQQLERAFSGGHYPDVVIRESLAAQLQLSEARIQVGLFSLAFYRPQMRHGNAFGLVCVCVCLSICPVRAVTFERIDLQTSGIQNI